jgi:hypothetical protein
MEAQLGGSAHPRLVRPIARARRPLRASPGWSPPSPGRCRSRPRPGACSRRDADRPPRGAAGGFRHAAPGASRGAYVRFAGLGRGESARRSAAPTRARQARPRGAHSPHTRSGPLPAVRRSHAGSDREGLPPLRIHSSRPRRAGKRPMLRAECESQREPRAAGRQTGKSCDIAASRRGGAVRCCTPGTARPVRTVETRRHASSQLSSKQSQREHATHRRSRQAQPRRFLSGLARKFAHVCGVWTRLLLRGMQARARRRRRRLRLVRSRGMGLGREHDPIQANAAVPRNPRAAHHAAEGSPHADHPLGMRQRPVTAATFRMA